MIALHEWDHTWQSYILPIVLASIPAVAAMFAAYKTSRTRTDVTALTQLNTDQHASGRHLLNELSATVLGLDAKLDELGDCSRQMAEDVKTMQTWQVGHDAHHLRVDTELRELGVRVRQNRKGR